MTDNVTPLRQPDVTDLVEILPNPSMAEQLASSTAPAPQAPQVPKTMAELEAQAAELAKEVAELKAQAVNTPKVWVTYAYAHKKDKQKFGTMLIEGMFDLRTHQHLVSLANIIAEQRKQEGIEILFWKQLEG